MQNDGLSDLERTVDKFSGFITKEQAENILKADYSSSAKVSETRKQTTSAKELLKSISSKEIQQKPEETESIVNIKDYIYRIFNPVNSNIKGKETTKRTVILGEEGTTLVLNLRDKLSEFIDINTFERGDTVMITNAILDLTTGELRTNQSTIINKVTPTKLVAINDYSTIREELRKVDVVGRIMEISPIRHVSRLGTGQIAVASCIISDSTNSIDISFWGSSAIKTALLKTNDFVKLEFCDVRIREGKMQVYVNDDSRVLASNIFSPQLKK